MAMKKEDEHGNRLDREKAHAITEQIRALYKVVMYYDNTNYEA